MTFKTQVKCKYCKKAFLDGLKGIRKEPFVCNECEQKQKELFMSMIDLKDNSIRFNDNSEDMSIDSSIASEVLSDLSPAIKRLQEAEASLERYL